MDERDSGKLKEEIEILTNQERAEIARLAIHSLDQGVDDDAEAAWEVELARRVSVADFAGTRQRELIDELDDP